MTNNKLKILSIAVGLAVSGILGLLLFNCFITFEIFSLVILLAGIAGVFLI